MKLNYKDWNEADKAPPKRRFVQNEIELSERRMRHLLDIRSEEIRKEMDVIVSHNTVVSLVIIALQLIVLRLLFHKISRR